MALTPKDLIAESNKQEEQYINQIESYIDSQLVLLYNPDERNVVRIPIASDHRWSFRAVATKVLALYSKHWRIEVQNVAACVALKMTPK